MTDKSREAFEVWYLSEYPTEAPRFHWVDPTRNYANMFTRLHFKGWQAGRKQAIEACIAAAEGERVSEADEGAIYNNGIRDAVTAMKGLL